MNKKLVKVLALAIVLPVCFMFICSPALMTIMHGFCRCENECPVCVRISELTTRFLGLIAVAISINFSLTGFIRYARLNSTMAMQITTSPVSSKVRMNN